MKQVLIIHGGNSFPSQNDYLTYLQSTTVDYERLKYAKKWKPWLAEQLSDSDVLVPSFPNADNASYEEWKIYFEKIIPYLRDNAVIIGHSLGATFIAKYLHENPGAVFVDTLILIAGLYTDDPQEAGSFTVGSITKVSESAQTIHAFHSSDDMVVSYDNIAIVARDVPSAHIHSFDQRGHFNEPTFPELLELVTQK
jgi:predicted alpha/beta hydrolase family esterase